MPAAASKVSVGEHTQVGSEAGSTWELPIATQHEKRNDVKHMCYNVCAPASARMTSHLYSIALVISSPLQLLHLGWNKVMLLAAPTLGVKRYAEDNRYGPTAT